MANNRHQRPGVMLYFDMRAGIKFLSNEEKGILFESILDFAETGDRKDFAGNDKLLMAWNFIKPKLEYDQERYEIVCQKRVYAGYVKKCKQCNIEPLTFEEWYNEKNDNT